MVTIIFLAKGLLNPNNLSIFAATVSATLSLRPANQGGSFAFMTTLRLYTKQALSIAAQIALLKNRGLQIADESKATKFLGEVSYFRLRHAKQRGVLNFTDNNPHEVCVFEIARMKCLKYVNFKEFLYLSEYQHVTDLVFRRLKKRAPKPQLLGVESLGLMR